jgi:lysophospholipase L1-like esterase
MRRMLGNLAALALATAVAVLLGEAVLRPFVTLPLRRTLPEVRYDPHPVRRFTLRPNQRAFTYGAPVAIDARGFRGGPGADGAARLLALGDSFTFGLGVNDDETWPAQVERELRTRTGQPVTVVNTGTISYGVFQEADLLRERGLEVRPATVVHGLYWNDFMNAAAPKPGEPAPLTADGYFVWDRLQQKSQGMRASLSALANRSALVYSVRQAVASVSRDGAGTSAYGRAFERFVQQGLTPEEWEPIAQFYRDLLSLGQANGFRMLVVILPVSDLSAQPASAPHPYATQAANLLRSLGIPAVDAFTALRQDPAAARYFLPQGSDAHLNAAGYARIAPAIAEALAANAALSAPPARDLAATATP